MRYILSLLIILTMSASVFALTPKEQKGVKTLKSLTVEYLSPPWFDAHPNIDKAPEDIKYWTSLLPYEEDKQEDMYIVLPTLGLISPVVPVPEGTTDYKNMTQGKEIDINKYLVEGVMFYPRTGKIGQAGNPVIFGHSNFYKVGKGKYKTIFADIMNLDVGQDDEMRVYTKDPKNLGEYDMYKYRINESYETNPENVSILKPKGGKELTVFACTDGLNGRWILRGKLIESDEMLILNAMRKKFDSLTTKLKGMSKLVRQEKITKIIEKTQAMKEALPDANRNYKQKYRAYVIDYIERRLVEVY